jgi:hypothetical protein
MTPKDRAEALVAQLKKVGVVMSNPRAVRYRRLALVEQDNEKAQLFQLIADEADRGVLFTADWLSARPSFEQPAQTKPANSLGMLPLRLA